MACLRARVLCLAAPIGQAFVLSSRPGFRSLFMDQSRMLERSINARMRLLDHRPASA